MVNDQKDIKTLTKTRDLYKSLLISVCILWTCIFIAALYFYSKKGNIALFIPAFTSIAIWFPVYIRFRSLNAKVRSRNKV